MGRRKATDRRRQRALLAAKGRNARHSLGCKINGANAKWVTFLSPTPLSIFAQPLSLLHTLSVCPRSTQFCCRHLVTQNHFATLATTILEAAQMALEFEFEYCVCLCV